MIIFKIIGSYISTAFNFTLYRIQFFKENDCIGIDLRNLQGDGTAADHLWSELMEQIEEILEVI